MPQVDSADDVFVATRGALFGLAYRMLGSISDAEDVVSEAYLRWRRADPTQVDDTRRYLFTVTSRLAIDVARSARRNRVDYVGTWLPEPLVTSWDDPADHVEQHDTVSLGLLMLLEQLSPTERAVFVLREAFEFPHSDIADILGLTPANVRQAFLRGRRRLNDLGAPRFVADRRMQAEFVAQFLAAAATGDVQPLADLLKTDVVFYGDGGGKTASVRSAIRGHVRVARFLRTLARKAPPDLRMDVVRANGEPALLLRTATTVEGVYAFSLGPDGLVSAIHAVRNPDKMTRLSG